MEENSEHIQENSNQQKQKAPPEYLNSKTIPVKQEFITIHKEVVETGAIRIHKTITEEPISVNLPIVNETYDIKRVAVHEVHDTPPPPLRYEGDVIIIPVLREVTVVQKRYEVVEELHITRKLTETPMVQEITLLKEHINIERTENKHNE